MPIAHYRRVGYVDALGAAQYTGPVVVWITRLAMGAWIMAYTDFTLDMLIEQFGLQIQEASPFLAGFAPLPMSHLLQQKLEENVPLARDISTEKTRSEFIIAPVLVEVRRQCKKRISVFSGVEFTVDIAPGLRGVCDFLLSLSPLQLTMQAPVVAVDSTEHAIAQVEQIVGILVGMVQEAASGLANVGYL